MRKPEDLFSDLYGQYCWGVDWDSQLNLSLHFGEPWLSVWGPVSAKPDKRYARPKGKWWLWIWLSYWKLTLADGRFVTGASPSSRRGMAFSALDGQMLVEAKIDGQTGRTRLTFDLGAELDIRRMDATNDNELWWLYRPRGYVLTMRGDGTFEHTREKRLAARKSSIRPNRRSSGAAKSAAR